MVLKRCFAPFLRNGFILMLKHNGAKTFITYVTNVTTFWEGMLVAIYNRNSLVSQREWKIASGFLVDRAKEHCLFDIESHISHRYCWSVLKLFNNTQCISTGIFENSTTGIVLQAVNALPIGHENARGPEANPSKFCRRWWTGSSLVWQKSDKMQTNQCKFVENVAIRRHGASYFTISREGAKQANIPVSSTACENINSQLWSKELWVADSSEAEQLTTTHRYQRWVAGSWLFRFRVGLRAVQLAVYN